MKVINLDNVESPDIFYLWNIEYKYLFNSRDKSFYLKNILKLDSKKENKEELKAIFKIILEKQNIFVEIIDQDIKGLFDYFNSKFL